MCRNSTKLDQLLHEPGNLLNDFKDNIHIAEDPATAGISSTIIRQQLRQVTRHPEGNTHLPDMFVYCSLGLLLGTQAPVMTPNGIDFSFSSSSVLHTMLHATLSLHMRRTTVVCAGVGRLRLMRSGHCMPNCQCVLHKLAIIVLSALLLGFCFGVCMCCK